MKFFNFLFVLSLFNLFFVSCNKDNLSDPEFVKDPNAVNIHKNFDSSAIQVQSKIGEPPYSFANYLINVKSDYYIGGLEVNCYKVWVGVYLTEVATGQRFLAASDIVTIGGNAKSLASNDFDDGKCIGYLPDGNYVTHNYSGIQTKYCVLEILLNNETAYQLYQDSINQLIKDFGLKI